MQHFDDDRLLGALRGGLDEPAGDEDLEFADRVGRLARDARSEGLFDPAPAIDARAMAAAVHSAVAADATAPMTEGAEILAMRSRRGMGWLKRPGLIGAAAAALVVAAGLAAIVFNGQDDSRLLASADLDLLGDSGGAMAELIEVDDHLEIRLDTAGLSDPAVASGDGYLEVWMLAPDVSGLISLGPVREDGLYRLPDGFNPATMPVVDVSLEHFDGDPTHSGNSLVRGQLDL
ncbi:MAG: anti-sigma factor [Acidimicrobiales bacterium]|nr:anti-sigma factor [Acidimicrobiales bacterium]